MGLISRITKIGTGTINWIDGVGKTIFAAEANTDLNTVYTLVNGNLEAANIHPTAGITGGQIAADTITAANIAAKAVTASELANDAAVDASRAVGTDHVKNEAIIRRTLGLLSVSKAQMEIEIDVAAFSFPLDAGDPNFTTNVTPTITARAKASYVLIGAYYKNVLLTAGECVAIIRMEDSGANWVAKLDVTGNSVAAGATFSGSIEMIWLKLA